MNMHVQYHHASLRFLFEDTLIHWQMKSKSLTCISLSSFYGTQTISIDPYQMPQNAASDHGLHCTLTERYFKI